MVRAPRGAQWRARQGKRVVSAYRATREQAVSERVVAWLSASRDRAAMGDALNSLTMHTPAAEILLPASAQATRLAPTKRTNRDRSIIPIGSTFALTGPQSSTFSTGRVRVVRALQGSRRVRHRACPIRTCRACPPIRSGSKALDTVDPASNRRSDLQLRAPSADPTASRVRFAVRCSPGARSTPSGARLR